jgi:prepilin-type N-terminal cleavage/methylation domain-containing protein/prepilin-type processing-associated H-X9-DG protein
MTVTRPTDSIMRSAFTLIEMLICIAIVSLLLSIGLPAIQQVRESARAIHCQSNLRQFSLQSMAVSDAMKTLPESRVRYDATTGDLTVLTTWGRTLAQSVTGSYIDRGIMSDPSMLCPSGIESAVVSSEAFGIHQVQTSDYRGNMGVTGHERRPGPFSILYESGRKKRVADIVDGMSQTIYAWETIGSRYIFDLRCAGGFRMHVRYLVEGAGEDSGSLVLDAYHWDMIFSKPDADFIALHHASRGFASGYLYTFIMRESSRNYALCHFKHTSDYGGPFSLHPNAVNVAMCDGSVRVVSATISYPTIAAMTGMDDGVIIEDP